MERTKDIVTGRIELWYCESNPGIETLRRYYSEMGFKDSKVLAESMYKILNNE